MKIQLIMPYNKVSSLHILTCMLIYVKRKGDKIKEVNNENR